MPAVRAPLGARPSPVASDVPDELVSGDELKARLGSGTSPTASHAASGGFTGVTQMGPRPTPNGNALPASAVGGVAGNGCGSNGFTSAANGSTSSSSTAKSPEAKAYCEAMELMWNYQLASASQILEPWRSTSAWHAGAYAECSVLRVVLTGSRKEAEASLALVNVTEALLSSAVNGMPLVVQEVFAAEMLLLRCGLQVISGARLKALYNLRQCWNAYRRLQSMLSSNGKLEDIAYFSADDLRGRVNFGLGFFYLSTSLLPASLCPLARLAGFVIDRELGKAHLAAVTECSMSFRAPLAGILLAIYHLDLEPDVGRAGTLLRACLERRPQNVLLHWAGSLLAWRHACLDEAIKMIQQALECCGPELASQAVYLSYELGVLHFMSMAWTDAYRNLRGVYDVARTDKTFLPYRQLVTIELASVCFNLERNDEAESLCKECVASSDWGASLSPEKLRVEGDFVKLVGVFLKHRTVNRKLMAFEVMYFLRQLGRVPAQKLLELRAQIREVARPYAEHNRKFDDPQASRRRRSSSSLEMGFLVEHLSALMLECIILFYLADAEEALPVAAQLKALCPEAPWWGTYLAVHGLYWAGRIFSVQGQNDEARICFTQAKGYKKYPFNICVKVTKVLEELEREGAGDNRA